MVGAKNFLFGQGGDSHSANPNEHFSASETILPLEGFLEPTVASLEDTVEVKPAEPAGEVDEAASDSDSNLYETLPGEVGEEDKSAEVSAFWSLNPRTLEFSVFNNGGWKMVINFNSPLQDVNAHLSIICVRADDGSAVYSLEQKGIITSRHNRLSLDSDISGYDLYQLGFRPGEHLVIAYMHGKKVADQLFTVP